MKNTLLFLTIVLLFSCTKKENNLKGIDLDYAVEISVSDKAGNDLLNPATPNAFFEKSIRIFYVKDGVKKEFYESNLDRPRNFHIDETDGKYKMHLIAYSETHIQWNENDADTLRAEINKTAGNEVITKLWYKDSLIWTAENWTGGRYLDIIK